MAGGYLIGYVLAAVCHSGKLCTIDLRKYYVTSTPYHPSCSETHQNYSGSVLLQR